MSDQSLVVCHLGLKEQTNNAERGDYQ